MNDKIRRQLTLFLETKDAEIIEKIRKTYNPAQYGLIKAHVTLCREDEIENLEKVKSNLIALDNQAIELEFGKIERFENGKGIFLYAKVKHEAFDNLRKQILNDIIVEPRTQEPHITLMHPRNSTCTDEIFDEMVKMDLPSKFTFHKISLIEQEAGGPWRILEEYELRKTSY